MTNQNKKNQIYWLRYENDNLKRNLENAQKKIAQIPEIEKNPELTQEIEYLKSQFVDGDIAGNKLRIEKLESQLHTFVNLHTENEVLLREKDEKINEYISRVQNLEIQLQTSQDKNTEYEVLLAQKDETIGEYLRDIADVNELNRSLDSDQKFNKFFSVIVYTIAIWILNR